MIAFDVAHLFVSSLVFRLGVIVVTAALWRHQRSARRVAFIGSALAAPQIHALGLQRLGQARVRHRTRIFAQSAVACDGHEHFANAALAAALSSAVCRPRT